MFKGFVVSLLLLLTACGSTAKIDPGTAEGAFALGEKYEKDERFEEALAQFSQVKNKHPYSHFAIEAKLKIAQIHFDREDWIEAQNAYQVFKEMHPRHPKSDFVTFRLAMCYLKQLPATIDRDLAVSEKAVTYFDETIQSFPESEFVAQAKEYREKTLRMLADKEDYVGNFYFIHEQYDSALGRYEELLEKYAGLGLDEKALYRASYSAMKSDDLPKAKFYYQKLVGIYPQSESAKKLGGEISHDLK